jgi:hypothetical protein
LRPALAVRHPLVLFVDRGHWSSVLSAIVTLEPPRDRQCACFPVRTPGKLR